MGTEGDIERVRRAARLLAGDRPNPTRVVNEQDRDVDLLLPAIDLMPGWHRFFSELVGAVALMAVMALLVTAYLLGRATVHPDPQVYVVHDTELSTTTVPR